MNIVRGVHLVFSPFVVPAYWIPELFVCVYCFILFKVAIVWVWNFLCPKNSKKKKYSKSEMFRFVFVSVFINKLIWKLDMHCYQNDPLNGFFIDFKYLQSIKSNISITSKYTQLINLERKKNQKEIWCTCQNNYSKLIAIAFIFPVCILKCDACAYWLTYKNIKII